MNDKAAIKNAVEGMNIAVLHTGHAPAQLQAEYGDYDDMSKALLGLNPVEAPTFAVQEGEFPTAADDFDLYIITGSPSGVYDGHDWIAELEKFIRAALDAGSKFIGLCFGHQIIARALGGTVVKSEGGYGIGVMNYMCAATGETLSLCAWHQDQVIKAPDKSELILTSEFCPVAGLKYGNQAISFQPHPEFTREFVRDLINLREGETITPHQAEAARRTLSTPTSTPTIRVILNEFLQDGR